MSDETRHQGTVWRRRGGITGMVLAELREFAGSLGVDTTGLRRRQLLHEIRERLGDSVDGKPITPRVLIQAKITKPSDDHGWFTHTETVYGLDEEGGETGERITVIVNDSDTRSDDAEAGQVHVVDPPSLFDLEGHGEADGDADSHSENPPAGAPGPPPARLLSVASLLLAPGERENWLGELHTARWELRADRHARRRETWGYFQALGKSLVVSWRYRGDGPTQEVS